MKADNKKMKLGIRQKRADNFLEYMKSFFQEEDRLPSLTELSTKFEVPYTTAYKTLCYMVKSKSIEVRESNITNRRHYRFAR